MTLDPRLKPLWAIDLTPMRTLCSWCRLYGREPAVLLDVPEDERGLSHGICDQCVETWRKAKAS